MDANLRDRAVTSAGQVLIQAVIFGLAALHLTKKDLTIINQALIFPFVVLATVVPGLMDAHSFNTGVLALYVPVCLLSKDRFDKVVGCILSILCLYIGGRSAGGIIAATMLVLAWRESKLWAWSMIIGGAWFASTKWDQLTRFNDRGELLLQWCDFFRKNLDPAWGSGPGSFEWIAPFLPNTPVPFFLAHNDFFQAGFELGITGLVLVLAVVVDTLWKARHDVRLMMTGLSIVGLMIVYFPTHYAMSAALMSIFVLLVNHYDQEVSK